MANTPMRPLPADPIIQIDRRIYYARQAAAVHERTAALLMAPDCSVARKTKTETVEVFTPKGACRVDLITHRARGHKGSCHMASYLAATEPLKPEVRRLWQHAGQRTFAGSRCDVYRMQYGGMEFESCLHVPAGFSPYAASPNFTSPAGLILMDRNGKAGMEDRDDAMPYLEADVVQEGARVSAEVFLPQFQPGITIDDGEGSR